MTGSGEPYWSLSDRYLSDIMYVFIARLLPAVQPSPNVTIPLQMKGRGVWILSNCGAPWGAYLGLLEGLSDVLIAQSISAHLERCHETIDCVPLLSCSV